MADFFAKLQGMNGDHAKDQRKLARLLEEIKQFFLHQSLGEERLLGMDIHQVMHMLFKANEKKLEKVGGQSKWDALPEAQRIKIDTEMVSHLVLELGHEAYTQLSDNEKHKVDMFIWAGCAMHKDLNCVKGGNAAMMLWWEENAVTGPTFLANRDNAAVL